jgi:hypothetical protein
MNDGLNQGSSSSSSPSPSFFQSIKISGLRVDNVELSHLEGMHHVVACTLSFNNDSIRTYALIDSGATGMALWIRNLLVIITYPRPLYKIHDI